MSQFASESWVWCQEEENDDDDFTVSHFVGPVDCLTACPHATILCTVRQMHPLFLVAKFNYPW